MATTPSPCHVFTRSPFTLRLMLAGMRISLFTGSALAEKPFKVITTFTVMKDMARQVAGEAAEVHSITRPGAKVHDYQPTPREIVKTQKADLILWNGMNLERWFRCHYRSKTDPLCQFKRYHLRKNLKEKCP